MVRGNGLEKNFKRSGLKSESLPFRFIHLRNYKYLPFTLNNWTYLLPVNQSPKKQSDLRVRYLRIMEIKNIPSIGKKEQLYIEDILNRIKLVFSARNDKIKWLEGYVLRTYWQTITPGNVSTFYQKKSFGSIPLPLKSTHVLSL